MFRLMGQNSSHYLFSIAAVQTAYQTVLLTLLWNLTKTLKQLGASCNFCPKDLSKWFPLTMTLSLRDISPCRTQHFPYFYELEQWLGEVNTAVNGRYRMVPLFITLVVITTETPYWALAKLSPAKTEVTVAIRDQMLNAFHSLRFILTVLHAQMTAGKGCPPQFYKNIHCHGTRMRPPHEATATYFVSL